MNLKSLIEKLNDTGRITLESAAALCLSKTHYNIEIEHWLLTLIENKQNDVNLLLSEVSLNIGQLKNDLHKNLSLLKRGNSHSPALSQRLIDLMREALLISSLEYNVDKVRSAYLLLALFNNDEWRRFAQMLSSEFDKISPEKLREALPKIIEQSIENNEESEKIISSTSSALQQYTIDLTALARLGKLDETVGRESEISQMIDILLRRRQNNPILTGEPGVGKTAVVEGLACRIARGDIPSALKKVSLLTLDLGLLQAGAGIKGEFENRLKTIIQEVKNAPHPIILFVDEAHTLIGAGNQAGQGDAANLLKPALARGELRTIAATTWAEYKKYFEKDAALTRRFQVVKIEEPSVETAILMLRSVVSPLEKHHQCQILDEAVLSAVHLSHRYLSDRLLPDKAISVLDTACAHASVRATMPPCINAELIAEIISDWTGIPVGRMLTDELKNIIDLEKRLQTRIKGQNHALNIISERIKVSRANLGDPRRPIGTFLFVGPSGVGKTETALALTEMLYGSSQSLTTINLSEFKEEHKVSLLMGSPPGYVGYGEGGILTEAVRRRPYSLVLLDEVEKAHSGIQDIFYQVFDKGILKDGEGRDINFKNTVLILTSNAASSLITQLCADADACPTPEKLFEAIRAELLKTFKPAFLGRVTIVPYFGLDREVLTEIVDIQLERIKQRVMENYKSKVYFDKKIRKYLVEQCKHADTGARQIDHWLTQSLLPALSSYFLNALVNQQKIKQVKLSLTPEGEVKCMGK